MVPATRLINEELFEPFGSYTISFITILAFEDRPNTVPSMKVMPTVELAPDWTTSPFSTLSPMLRMIETPLRMTVAEPDSLVTCPITWLGAWALPAWATWTSPTSALTTSAVRCAPSGEASGARLSPRK